MSNNIENMSNQQQIKNAGIYLIPSIISSVLPILSLPIILRYLSPTEFGAYALSLGLANIVVVFCQLSLFDAYERNFFVYASEKERPQLLFTIVLFVSFNMIILGMVIFFFKDYLASWILQNQKYGSVLFFTFSGCAIQVSNNYYLSYLKNIGNAKLNVVMTLTASIAGVILSIYFVIQCTDHIQCNIKINAHSLGFCSE